MAILSKGKASRKRGVPNARADKPPHPVVLEIKRIADARQIKPAALARMYGGGIDGANVRRHWATNNPQEETIRRYAEVLEVEPEYLLLLLAGKFEYLPAPTHEMSDSMGERRWLNDLVLAFGGPDWEVGTDDVVRDAVNALPHGARRGRIKEFALAYYRAKYIDDTWHPLRSACAVFEAQAPPHLRALLAQRKRQYVRGRDRFVNLWCELVDVCDHWEFDAFLASVRVFHKKHDVDTAPMDEALHEDIRYRSWRGISEKVEALDIATDPPPPPQKPASNSEQIKAFQDDMETT